MICKTLGLRTWDSKLMEKAVKNYFSANFHELKPLFFCEFTKEFTMKELQLKFENEYKLEAGKYILGLEGLKIIILM